MGTLDDKLAKMLDRMIGERLDKALEKVIASKVEAMLGSGEKTNEVTPSAEEEEEPEVKHIQAEVKPAKTEKSERVSERLRPGAKIPRTDTRIGDVMHNRKILGLAGATPSGVRMVRVKCLGCNTDQKVNIGSWRHGGCLKCSAAKKGDKAIEGWLGNARLILSEVRAYLVSKNLPGHLGNAHQFKVMANLGYDPRVIGRAFSYLEAGKIEDAKLTATKRVAGTGEEREVLWAVTVLPDKPVSATPTPPPPAPKPPETPNNGPRVVPAPVQPKAPARKDK